MLSLLFWSVVAQSNGFFCVDSSGRVCPPNISGRSFKIEMPTPIVEITSAEDIEHPIDLSLVERRIEITGNGNTVRLFTSNSSTARVVLKNVTAFVTGDFRVAELDLEGSVLVGMNSSVSAGVVTIKTSELVDVTSVKAQFATIEIDKASKSRLFVEIEKVETEETQVVIRNSVSVDLVFGVNSLLFLLPESNVSLVQVFGVDYPRIEVFHVSGQMLVSCCSNMIPSVLLSPVIRVEGGVCVFGGENWPSRPRPRAWYWRFEHFFEGDDRTIWVVPAPEAELVIQGKDIPISIRADDGDPVVLNVAQVECGISGGIVLNTNTESVIHYFGRKPAVFNIGFLVEDGGKLVVLNELLTLRFDVCDFSDVVTSNGTLECRTINDTKRNVEQRVTLMPNGTIYMKLLMPFNELYTKIKKGYLSRTHFPDWVYTPEGNVNYLQALKFAASWMDNNRLKMAGIFQVLKRFGNTVHPVNITSDPQEQYHLHIERDDIPVNIFYSNPYKYGRPLIYTNSSFNMTNWDVTIAPYPTQNTRLPVKLSEMGMRPSFKTIVVNENEESFRWQLPEYPSSSAEVFIFCTDEELQKGLSYADGLLFHYVKPQSANKVASMLTNRKTKNVIFFALSDPSPISINLQGFRSDVNIMIVGLTINALKRLPRIDFSALAHIDIVGSFGSLYAAFVAGRRLKITSTKNVGLFMVNYSSISIQAENIVTDFTGFTPTLTANQLMLVPISSSMHYANLSSVEFVDDGWNCQYELKGEIPRTVHIPTSCAKERLNILGNIHDLTLHMNATIVTPTIIGPEYFDPKTGASELIGAPLLSEEDSEPLELIHKAINIVSETLSKSETGQSQPRVKFTGNWTDASLSDNGVRVRVSDNAVVENFPVDSVDKIEVLCDRRIEYAALDTDNLEVVTPQLVRGSKEFVVPDGKRVSFNNVTFLSRLSKLAVSSGALDVKHIRVGKDASANLSLVKLGTSIHMFEGSSLRIDSLSTSKEHVVEFTGRLSDRFPFLSLGPVDSIPKMVVNIEESDCELDQLLTQAHRIVEIESNTDRCSELTLELHARPDFLEEANLSAACQFDGKQMLVTVNTTLHLDGQISRFSFQLLNETDEEFDQTSTPVLEEKPYLQRMGVAFARVVIIIMVVAAVVFVLFIPRPVPGQFPRGIIDANEEGNLDRNDASSRVPVVPEDESDPIL